MQSKTSFTVEVDPFVLGELLPEGQRPALAPEQLDLFDLEVCPIAGFKGMKFVNPLRAAPEI